MNESITSNDSHILFELAGTTYALSSQEVRHLELVEQITPVPTAPPFVEGVVFSRGQLIPAVNLRIRLGFPRQAHTVRSRLIVVEVSGRTAGLLVDAAREFRILSASNIHPPGEFLAGMSGRYLRGVALVSERLIMVLDLNAVLAFEEAAPENLEALSTSNA